MSQTNGRRTTPTRDLDAAVRLAGNAGYTECTREWRDAVKTHRAVKEAFFTVKRSAKGSRHPDFSRLQHALIDATARVCELQLARGHVGQDVQFLDFSNAERANRDIGFMTAHELAEKFGTDEAAEEESIQAECDRVAGRE
jgi:hypothetical protein